MGQFMTGSPLKPQNTDAPEIPRQGGEHSGGTKSSRGGGGGSDRTSPLAVMHSGEMETPLPFAYPEAGDAHSFLRQFLSSWGSLFLEGSINVVST